ncbi:MAG: hypothetical protein Q8K55_05865 [Gemmatimonadaceae bacterium]|nr:hypothetical protein [Gemmatimonadaceae bacterium]
MIQLNVCHFAICNLVQMEAHLSANGDSGGAWYWNFTAYPGSTEPGRPTG